MAAKIDIRRVSKPLERRREPRSPLKEKPLRQAGQSVEEIRQRILDDAFTELLIPLMALLVAALEWWRYWSNTRPQPWLFTTLGLIAVGVVGHRFRQTLKDLRRYREGRDGERIVAERLDQLRELGFRLFHDVVVSNFNIDHVAIGPSGIFAMETKTLKKLGGHDETAEFDGTAILVKGSRLPRNPVDQACASARWLREFLHQSTGQWFNVTPVVILPGWYVTAKSPMRQTIVVNDHPNSLESWLVKRRDCLSSEQIALISTHLSLFIRRPKA